MKITNVTNDDIVTARSNENNLNKFITSLIVDNQGFFYNIINRYDNQYDPEELYQEALIGLNKAIKAFSVEKAKENNNKFITYAQRVIVNNVLDSVKKTNKFYNNVSSIEQFKGDNDSLSGESNGSDYHESKWKKKDLYVNFDECLTEKIQADNVKNRLSVNERLMFDCRIVNRMNVKDTLRLVSEKNGISVSTARMIYYNSFKQKIKEGLG